MQDATPSRTALSVALRRAVHQVMDVPSVFVDPVALRILPPELAARITPGDPATLRPGLRALLVARSALAEQCLAEAYQNGVRHYVVLGAGFDTFAYRNPWSDLQVYEIDHPATQSLKRDLLAKAAIEVPGNVHFGPSDFERRTVDRILADAGVPRNVPVFFSWLGVTPYLSLDAFRATLAVIGSWAPGSAVVFDYAADSDSLTPHEQAVRQRLAERVATAGEPFQLFFCPGEVRSELEQAGFKTVAEYSPAELNGRYFAARKDSLRLAGGMGYMIYASA